MYVIGIDIGTSSTKGVLTDLSGNVLSHQRYYHQVEHPNPGWAEQDADAVWWGETVKIIRDLLAHADVSADRIAAIGCSGICPVVLPIDAAGKPLRNAILYSIDSRAIKQIQALNDKVGADAVFRSGQPLATQSVMPKLMWLRENEPEVWSRTSRILGSSGYLAFRLCGEMTADPFTASDGGYGYLARSCKWDSEAFAAADIDMDVMPKLCWPTEIAGYVHAAAARETGLREGTPVIVGTGDALSEMLSTGIGEIGETAILYGSSVTTMTILDRPWYHEGFITTPGWAPGIVLTSAILGSGTRILSWWSQLRGQAMDDDIFHSFEREAAAIDIGADGLIALPYLTGMRSPFVDSGLRGALLGLADHHRSGHIVRALMEGIGYALRHALESLPVNGKIRAVGGGAKSELLVQIVSDVCRLPQEIVSGSVGAPLGSAWLAGAGAGLLAPASYMKWVGTQKRIMPQTSHAGQYDTVYSRFLTYLNAVRELHTHRRR